MAYTKEQRAAAAAAAEEAAAAAAIEAAEAAETTEAAEAAEAAAEQAAADLAATAAALAVATANAAVTTPAQSGVTIKKKKLSRWALEGLDIADAGFSKLQSKEGHFEKDGKLYDLNPETFKKYRDNLIEKVERMFSKGVFLSKDDDSFDRDIMKEYSRLSDDNIKLARGLRWPTTDPIFSTQSKADQYTDAQIKASTIGSYINESLTAAAKEQLKSDQAFFKVKDADNNAFFDGPSYFFKITEVVDPDNGQLIDDVKRAIRSLSVKDFGFSIIKMLAEFKNLKTRVEELGGTYSKDEQFFDFWQSIGTMQEEEFKRYAKQEKDSYSEASRASRDSLDKYIKKFSNKEVRMRASKEWNVMSTKDSMVMALVTMLEDKPDTSKKDKKNSNLKDSEYKELSPEEKLKRRESRIPDWKKVAPNKGDGTTKERDNRTYHWCSKCRSDKGMWALHSLEDHKSDFKPKFQQKTETKAEDTKDKEQPKKKVSFAAAVTGDSNPSIQVKKSLLTNAKAYLAQFSDFQEGGSQAE